jgi:hypothetical protein
MKTKLQPHQHIHLTTIFILLLVFTFQSIAQDSSSLESKDEVPLFSEDEPLLITIKSDFKSLIKGKKSEDPAYQAAELIHTDSEGGEEVFEIKIKPRGITRRINTWCSFPPLMLNFKKKAVENTVFAGQDKLKLVAYCKNNDANEQYNIMEYLVYKVYQLFTPYSFKVRLVQVTYVDTSEKYKPVTRYGFIIEHEKALAERNGGEIAELKLNNHDRCDRRSIDIFTCFQFMVGNTDWWVGNQHNVKILVAEGKMPIPVPYDFDITGVVNVNYASPDERLGIATVRERLFRGYCRRPGEYEEILSIFNEKKEEIYDIYRTCEILDEKQLKGTLAYYDQFYEIINDPGSVSSNFYEACPLSHQHLY